MRTVTAIVENELQLRFVLSHFIIQSQWFAVTPLPDGEWEIEVKAENELTLERAVEAEGMNVRYVGS